MNPAFQFDQVARLPSNGDNVAIATQRLEPGSMIAFRQQMLKLSSTILEGHRFAVNPIKPGDWLLSWGLPFGRAIAPIEPGDYACNEQILKALTERHVGFDLPNRANFKNEPVPFHVDEKTFKPGLQVPPVPNPRKFLGYVRPGSSAIGTRNFIAVLGTSSRTSGFARTLAGRFKAIASRFPGLDGVVALCHTEGGGATVPNNLDLSLRTLAGFLGHPNLAAVLAVDEGDEPLNNARLREAVRLRWPDGLMKPTAWLGIRQGWDSAIEAGTRLLEGWLSAAAAAARVEVPLSGLKLGLQCGGSDAFSGISGNPLVGCMARDVVRHGGAANLAETTELIGAEPYVLSNVRDLHTAYEFLRVQNRYQEWAGWHGHSAEGNPSGGNMFRGLYNIAIKSIGAGRKKDPEVRLDYVIDFGAPMESPGFYFMDSPGNDLESIAGQVASGCNLILFATGNGSITNFPFVPTIKVMTSTRRYLMLQREMDINAGRYLDGESMETLSAEAFEQMLRVVSGEKTAGELAGHAQLQLWREWRQTGLERRASSVQIPLESTGQFSHQSRTSHSLPLDSRGIMTLRNSLRLILPTSLCAGQIAGIAAERLNQQSHSSGKYVHLPHTEGCGNSAGDSEAIMLQILAGHVWHSRIQSALLMEHGCEKTHNDAFRNLISAEGGNISRLGWVSIQLDGGLESCVEKTTRWFAGQKPGEQAGNGRVQSPPCLGVAATETVDSCSAEALRLLCIAALNQGFTVAVASGLSSNLAAELLKAIPNHTRILCGRRAAGAGLFLMDTPTDDLVEVWTALAAAGAECILSPNSMQLQACHPFVPVIQTGPGAGLDPWKNRWSPMDFAVEMARTVSLADSLDPFGSDKGAFQVTRGMLGVSL